MLGPFCTPKREVKGKEYGLSMGQELSSNPTAQRQNALSEELVNLSQTEALKPLLGMLGWSVLPMGGHSHPQFCSVLLARDVLAFPAQGTQKTPEGRKWH